ncbi:DUF1036 domain-containing protein [Zhengella mangrovi]|uniref:DUF1036 domain-containing protein n=1 Tax=Zhengella mangrovi TaxID=1982044 RepID=UPI000E0954D1|nr:DUF1036 domain-containing protein [Zhengella mangrovi]
MRTLSFSFLLSILIVFPVRHASADLTICNKAGHTISFAIVSDFWNNYYQSYLYRATGWRHIGDGVCRKVVESRDPIQAFLSVKAIRDDYEPYMIPTDAVNWDNLPWKEGVSGMAKFFCISNKDPFNYVIRYLYQLDSCQKNQYKQLFNIFIATKKNQNLSLDITSPKDP